MQCVGLFLFTCPFALFLVTMDQNSRVHSIACTCMCNCTYMYMQLHIHVHATNLTCYVGCRDRSDKENPRASMGIVARGLC